MVRNQKKRLPSSTPVVPVPTPMPAPAIGTPEYLSAEIAKGRSIYDIGTEILKHQEEQKQAALDSAREYLANYDPKTAKREDWDTYIKNYDLAYPNGEPLIYTSGGADGIQLPIGPKIIGYAPDPNNPNSLIPVQYGGNEMSGTASYHYLPEDWNVTKPGLTYLAPSTSKGGGLFDGLLGKAVSILAPGVGDLIQGKPWGAGSVEILKDVLPDGTFAEQVIPSLLLPAEAANVDIDKAIDKGGTATEVFSNVFERLADPTNSVNYSLENIGEVIPDSIKPIIPAAATIIGNIAGGPAFGALGTGIGAHLVGADSQQALTGAGLSAIMGYGLSGLKDAASGLLTTNPGDPLGGGLPSDLADLAMEGEAVYNPGDPLGGGLLDPTMLEQATQLNGTPDISVYTSPEDLAYINQASNQGIFNNIATGATPSYETQLSNQGLMGLMGEQLPQFTVDPTLNLPTLNPLNTYQMGGYTQTPEQLYTDTASQGLQGTIQDAALGTNTVVTPADAYSSGDLGLSTYTNEPLPQFTVDQSLLTPTLNPVESYTMGQIDTTPEPTFVDKVLDTVSENKSDLAKLGVKALTTYAQSSIPKFTMPSIGNAAQFNYQAPKLNTWSDYKPTVSKPAPLPQVTSNRVMPFGLEDATTSYLKDKPEYLRDLLSNKLQDQKNWKYWAEYLGG